MSPRRSGSKKSGKKAVRIFVIEKSNVKGFDGKEFPSKTPAIAARKAGRAIWAKTKCTKNIVLAIRETTPGSSKENLVKTYTVTRAAASKIVMFNGNPVELKNVFTVKAGGRLSSPCKKKSPRRSGSK
jgi:hypothetical protein